MAFPNRTIEIVRQNGCTRLRYTGTLTRRERRNHKTLCRQSYPVGEDSVLRLLFPCRNSHAAWFWCA